MAKDTKRWVSGIGGFAVALALLLFSNLTRHEILVVCFALWCCLLFLSSGYIRRGSSTGERIGRRILTPLFWGLIVTIFGGFFWPPILTVTPKRVNFSPLPMAPNQIYDFTLRNRSSEDVYLAELDLTFHGPEKPLAKGPQGSVRFDYQEQRLGNSPFNDVIKLSCRDVDGNPLVIFSIEHLSPGESRKVRVTYVGPAGPSMTAETGYYTAEASPISSAKDGAGRMLHFSHPVGNAPCAFINPFSESMAQ